MFEIELIPVKELNIVYYFIGALEDRSKLKTFMHATGAISVVIFGIIYLRSRRIDFMMSVTAPLENLNESNLDKPVPRISSQRVSKTKGPFKDSFEEDSSFEVEDDNEQYLIWKIYDKILDAFTSEFVVLNLCRLGLCFWILRYN